MQKAEEEEEKRKDDSLLQNARDVLSQICREELRDSWQEHE